MGMKVFLIGLNNSLQTKTPRQNALSGRTKAANRLSSVLKDQVTILRGTNDICLNSDLYSDSPIFLILADPSL